jgi:GNAT superfamily N-acetyltransferase
MIRLFKESDVEACAKIYRLCVLGYPELRETTKENIIRKYSNPKWMVKRFSSKKYPIFVFEEDNNILATGGLGKKLIEDLYVHPEHQGKGIGTEMLGFLEQFLIKRGDEKAWLWCFRSSLGFYENHGYYIHRNFFEEWMGQNLHFYECVKRL